MATLPPPDMVMDMSSPGHRVDQDNDIEIDLGDYPIGVEMTDDEHMLEDGEQIRPDTATDENMEDDEHTAITEEAVMIDETLPEATTLEQDYDDELIDYEDEPTEQQPMQSVPSEMNAPPSGTEVFPASLDTFVAAPIITEAGVADLASTASAAETTGQEAHKEQQEKTGEPSEAVQPSADESLATAEAEAQEDRTTDQPAIQQAIVSKDDEPDAKAAPEEPSVEEGPVDDNPATTVDQEQPSLLEIPIAESEKHVERDVEPDSHPLPTESADATSHDVPPTPTDTGLHPVMVKYRETEFPLFRSRTATNGLLEDDNLASLSLSELMSKCREQLAINTGEKVSDDQELCLVFEHMRSSLRENDPRAFEFSLKEVLDVFVHLHENDGVETLPPMWLTIELTWNFSKLYSHMKHAASENYGMSNFDFVKTANDNYYQDEGEESDEHNLAPDHHDETYYYENDGDYPEEFVEGDDGEGVDDLDEQEAAPVPQADEPQDNIDEVVELPLETEEFSEEQESHGPPAEDFQESKAVSSETLPPPEPSGNISPNDQEADEGHVSNDTAAAVPDALENSNSVASPATSATLPGDVNREEDAGMSKNDPNTENHEEYAQSGEYVDVYGTENEHEADYADQEHQYDDAEAFEGDTLQGEHEQEQDGETAFNDLEEYGDESLENLDACGHEEDGDEGDHEEAGDETTFHTTYEFNEEEEAEVAKEDAPAAEDTTETDLVSVDHANGAIAGGELPSASQDILAEEEGLQNDHSDHADGAEPASVPPAAHENESPNKAGDHGGLKHSSPPSHSKSPHGKRRLDDHDDFDYIDFADDQPDSKKPRAE